MFKEGDKVRIKNSCSGCKAGEVYTLHVGDANGRYGGLYAWDNDIKNGDSGGCSCQENWELIYNNNTMNLIEKMKLAMLGEPEKTLTKAGVLGYDGNLTSDGKDLFQAYLFNKMKNEFTEDVVKKIVEEEEK